MDKRRVKNYRRSYYSLFSRFYDRFVALHASDAQHIARRYLAELVPVSEGDRVLDLCTGTVPSCPTFAKRWEEKVPWWASIFLGGCWR